MIVPIVWCVLNMYVDFFYGILNILKVTLQTTAFS